MSIQMIGIDEDTFREASEEDRISWAKANTTAGFGLCAGALGWLVNHKDSVGWEQPCSGLCDIGKTTMIHDEYVYRLSPDYQPPVKRWWFDTETGIVFTADAFHNFTGGTIEVSKEYAAYLQAKPDCECELRPVVEGDDYISYGASDVPPYRWCKPRKPEVPRYEAKEAEWIKYVWDNKGMYTVCQGNQMQDMHRIAKAMNAMEKKQGGGEVNGTQKHAATTKPKRSYSVRKLF